MESDELVFAGELLIEANRLAGTSYDHACLWRLITTGAVPAQRVRGRWKMRRSERDALAELLRSRQPATAT